MKAFRILYLIPFVFLSFTTYTSENCIVKKTKFEIEEKIESVYYSLNSNNFSLPNLESFSDALQGYYELKERGVVKKDFLTIIDFSLSSKTKRLWVVDVVENKIVYNSLVAHGVNSGFEYASKFSNLNDSYKSSLGFYSTGETYYGTHGLSLKLDGLEKGINDKARSRSIVMHGAEYVSNKYIKNHKILGRSQGCPALPIELNAKIVNTIKGKSCVFIYHPTKTYKKSSKLVS